MNLDSVRSLKTNLVASVVPAFVEEARAVRAYGLSAEPLGKTKQNLRALALGVAPAAKNDFKLAIRIQHRALQKSPQVEQITREARGEVDVRYIGRVDIRAAWYRQRQRPLLIGSSIGHYRITAGTLGAFVRSRQGGPVGVLSNNHVLANENRAQAGDSILQPGAYDGGKDPNDAVAKLSKFVQLNRTGSNLVDAAVATVNDEINIDASTLTGIGRLNGVSAATATADLAVAKVGRTTGVTHGRVSVFELDGVMVNYDIGTLRFDNQLEIEADNEAFSAGGDSGSLIVDGASLAVGLLFAGSDQGGEHGHGMTYANPIQLVLDGLDVDLAL